MKVLHQGDFKDFLVAQPNKEIHSVFAKEKEEPNIPGKRGKNPPRKSKFYPINGEESTNVKPLANFLRVWANNFPLISGPNI